MTKIKDVLKFLDDSCFDYLYEGDKELTIKGFSSLSNYKEETVTWIKTQNAADNFDTQQIQVAVVEKGIRSSLPNQIKANQSKAVFFSILEHFFDTSNSEEIPRIGSGTYISPKVKIGNDVIIGHNCTLDGDITLGAGTRIFNNVNIINKVTIGKNCIIQSCVNIGHDGFAFTESETHSKSMVKHYGGVTIGDDVYIGGSTCIERGTIDDTYIADGAKIDVTCTIGHNCIVGKNSAIVGGSVLLGSVKLDENVYVASALIKNQGCISENAIIGMGSVVTKDVEKNEIVVGVPARPLKKRNE